MIEGQGSYVDKILFIEDEDEFASSVSQWISKQGYLIQTAQNAADGLYYLIEKSFDLILLDMVLSDFDALELCRIIRKEKDLPVLMFCQSRAEGDYEKLLFKALDAGADDLLFFDDRKDILLLRIRAALSFFHRIADRYRYANEISVLEDLQLDRHTRRIWKDGKEISLTAKEFDLLAYFMSHPGEILSKSEIFQEVWGMEALGDNTTVTVFVNKIREKLEALGESNKYIETVWGKGYRFRGNER